MNPILIQTLIFILSFAFSFADQILLTYDLINDNWQGVLDSISHQKLLRLNYEGLTQQNLNRILSLQLPQLQQLHFQFNKSNLFNIFRNEYSYQQVLTPKLIKTLILSNYFPRLITLNLRSTNIDDRYLAFLQNVNLTTSINKLILQQNFIGKKGYKLLSKIKFTNLKGLNLAGTLLKETESIDSLIQIICGQNEKICANNIEQLDISKTNIQGQQLIRLINRLNGTSLKKLSLNSLSLIYKTTYKQGFNYTAFEVLSKKFTSLQMLNLQQSLINDEIAFIFQNWSLPHLTQLNLQNNHITDKGVKLWINKKNMPNLQHLNLISTEVSDETIEHLSSQKYELVSLTIGNSKITAKGGQKLKLLNTYRLQSFYFSFNMPSKELNNMIEDGKFKNLKSLLISQNSLLVDVFTAINWPLLTKLQYLTLHKVHINQIKQNFLNSQSFSNIKTLVLIKPVLNINNFLLFVGDFFPKLQQLIIKQAGQITIFPSILWSAGLNQNIFIQISQMQIIKRKDKFQVINIFVPQFVFFSENQNQSTFQGITSRFTKILGKYDFQRIQQLSFNQQIVMELYFNMFDYANIKVLPKLTLIQIGFSVDFQFVVNTLSKIHLPCLKYIKMSLLVGSDIDDKGLAEFINKFSVLYGIQLEITYFNQQKSIIQRKIFLDSLYFPFLTSLVLENQNMEVEEVAQIVRAHNQTVRLLNLGNNFLEKGFIKIIIESQYVLEKLSLDSTSFSVQEFALFGKITTQFIKVLFVQKNDLKNEHILAMIISKNSSLLFPKLQLLGLQGNDVRKQGLQAMLQTHMYQLTFLFLNQNKNPHYINSIFSYPTKIKQIQAIDVNVYGIQNDLQPLSASNLNTLILKTKSFIKQDFYNLARLSFSELQSGAFLISNQYSCKTLINLLKITKNAKQIQIHFENDGKGLKSSCLQKISHTSRLSSIEIIDIYHTTNLSQFVQRLLNSTSELTSIHLQSTRLSPYFFNKVFKQSFNQLQGLNLRNNYVGNEAIQNLLNSSSLSNLIELNLRNTGITDYTIQVLASQNLYNLRMLILDQNELGETAMNSLKLLKTNLQILSLRRCGLNKNSLKIISKFKFESLVLLQLGYNNFEQMDIVHFFADIQNQYLPKLLYIELLGVSLTKEKYEFATSILKSKNISCILDAPHNNLKVNSARY